MQNDVQGRKNWRHVSPHIDLLVDIRHKKHVNDEVYATYLESFSPEQLKRFRLVSDSIDLKSESCCVEDLI